MSTPQQKGDAVDVTRLVIPTDGGGVLGTAFELGEEVEITISRPRGGGEAAVIRRFTGRVRGVDLVERVDPLPGDGRARLTWAGAVLIDNWPAGHYACMACGGVFDPDGDDVECKGGGVCR